jgi:hypothetical protein
MTLLTDATDVFAAATTSGRAAVAFLASYVEDKKIFTPVHARAVDDVLAALSREGWHLSVAAMIDDDVESEPAALPPVSATMSTSPACSRHRALVRRWTAPSDSSGPGGRGASRRNG